MYSKPYKRNGIYYFKVTINGKRVQRSTGKRTSREAQKYIRDFIDQLDYEQITLRKYVQPYLKYETSPRVRRVISEGRTIGKRYIETQASYFRRFVFEDEIADIPISKITSADIIDFRSRLISKTHAHMNTAGKVFMALKSVFSEAKRRQDIPADPTAGLNPIQYEKQVRSILPLHEIVKLFSTPELFPSKLAYQVFRFAAFTGARQSEVLAIRWDQIDDSWADMFGEKFNGTFLTINRAWKGKGEVGAPKSGKERIIPLAPSIMDHLPEKKHELVFCHDNGKRLGETWWRKNWIKVSDTKAHALRHALNSYLIKDGQPLQYIQQYMGWSRKSLTRVLEGYTHIHPPDLNCIASAIDRIYLPKQEDKKIIQFSRNA